MACVFGVLVAVGLAVLGFAVLLGIIEPREALKRAAAFFALLLLGPPLLGIVLRSVVLPALGTAWSVVKPVLLVLCAALLLLAIARATLAISGLVKRKSNRQHKESSSGEE